jgi:hypothetical protein
MGSGRKMKSKKLLGILNRGHESKEKKEEEQDREEKMQTLLNEYNFSEKDIEDMKGYVIQRLEGKVIRIDNCFVKKIEEFKDKLDKLRLKRSTTIIINYLIDQSLSKDFKIEENIEKIKIKKYDGTNKNSSPIKINPKISNKIEWEKLEKKKNHKKLINYLLEKSFSKHFKDKIN